jgi:hypothetical protein
MLPIGSEIVPMPPEIRPGVPRLTFDEERQNLTHGVNDDVRARKVDGVTCIRDRPVYTARRQGGRLLTVCRTVCAEFVETGGGRLRSAQLRRRTVVRIRATSRENPRGT